LNADISAFYDAQPDAAVLEDATWGQVRCRWACRILRVRGARGHLRGRTKGLAHDRWHPPGNQFLARPGQGKFGLLNCRPSRRIRALRYVIVVSSNAQNHHPRASTVVVVPIGTTLPSELMFAIDTRTTDVRDIRSLGECITNRCKKDLRLPRSPLRTLSRGTVVKILKCVVRAMGVLPSEIAE